MDLSVFVFVCQWMNELKLVRCNRREKNYRFSMGKFECYGWMDRTKEKIISICFVHHGTFPRATKLSDFFTILLVPIKQQKICNSCQSNWQISCLRVSVSNEIRLIELTSNALFVQIIFYHAVRLSVALIRFEWIQMLKKIGISRFFKHNEHFWQFNNEWTHYYWNCFNFFIFLHN